MLALGLALRFIIAYVLLPGSGFGTDIISFQGWAGRLATEGPGTPLPERVHRLHPGYMYVLWLIGSVAPWLGGIGDLIKLPPILADAAIGYLAWSMARELGARQSVALLAALFFILNPVSWFDSAVWGQVDSFGVVFLLLGLRELWRDRPERAAIFTMIAAVIKPQLGILVPLVAIITIRRALWPAGGYGDDAPPDPVEPRPASSGGSCPGSARPAVRSDPDDGPRRPDHDGHPRGPIQPVGGGADSAGAVRAPPGSSSRSGGRREDTRTSPSTPTTPGRSSPATAA